MRTNVLRVEKMLTPMMFLMANHLYAQGVTGGNGGLFSKINQWLCEFKTEALIVVSVLAVIYICYKAYEIWSGGRVAESLMALFGGLLLVGSSDAIVSFFLGSNTGCSA